MSEWKVLKGEYICALWNDKIYHVHEPIVRCRDCKHKGTIIDCAGISQMLCKRKEQVAFVIEPDGFCKWGERREK